VVVRSRSCASEGCICQAIMRPHSEPATRDPEPTPILFVHASDDLYGSDVIILEIVRRLDRAKFYPIVVLPDDMKHVGLLSRELAAAGIEYHHLPILILRRRYLKPQGLFHTVKCAVVGTWALRKLIRQREVRLIHCTTLSVLAGPLAAWATRTPLIAHVQEMLIDPKIIRKALHAIARYSSDKIICISDSVKAHILEDQPNAAKIIEVVRNSIPSPAEPNRTVEEMRNELGLAEGLPVVGMIGRVSPWKGQEIFVRAAAILRSEGVACQFVAIGGVFDKERQHLDRLKETIRSLDLENLVKIEGFRKDARELITAFDVFVLPSILPEPFGLVVAEAMAAGKPVIATAHGGPTEMVVEGKTGFLIPPNDPYALASAIKTLLTHPEEAARLGRAGRKRFLDHFEMREYVQRIVGLYEATLVSQKLPKVDNPCMS
jgi:glycosyltransferase involved in cell wall biosynthesis